MARTNDAEGGSDGVTVATSDTGSGDAWEAVSTPAGGITAYSNLRPAHGSLGYRFATRATAGRSFVRWSVGVAMAKAYGRTYLNLDTVTTTSSIVQHRETTAGQISGTMWINATGPVLRLVGGDGGVDWNGSVSLTDNTSYRVEWHCNPDGANSLWQIRLYLGDSTTALEDSGVITAGNSVSHTSLIEARLGVSPHADIANIPSSTGHVYYDDIVAFDTTWPGPAAVAAETQSFFVSRRRSVRR